MDWIATDEMRDCQELAERFAAEFLAPSQRRHEARGCLPDELLARYEALGLASLDWQEACGGAGLGLRVKCAVLEALARADAGAVPALDRNACAYRALELFGGEPAVRRHLQPVVEQLGATAHVHFDVDERLVVEGASIRGAISWTPLSRLDRLFVVRGGRMHVVDGGWTLAPVHGSGLLASGSMRIDLSGARVEATFTDVGAAGRLMAYARLCTAAAIIGQMQAANAAARDYAVDRCVFGRPVAHHQAMAFALVDMHMAVTSARMLLLEAAARYDRGEPVNEEAAQCFVEAAQASDFVGPFAVQVHGAAGFMRDYPVEKCMRELKTLSLMLGGIDAARHDALPRPQARDAGAYGHAFLLSEGQRPATAWETA